MKIKTFKERVVDTAIWTVSITIIFSIISYLFVNDFSEGSKYDHQKAYNLIKDTFTFGATLLTPIAAVIFFSDWREQHIAKELEVKSQKIYESIRKINSNIFCLKQEIDDEANLTKDTRSVVDLKFEQLSSDIAELGLLINNFDLKNSTTNDYVECSNNIKNELRGSLFYLERMFSALFRGNNPSDFNTQYENETNEDYSSHCELEYMEHSHNWFEGYANYVELEKDLELMRDKFRIVI